MWVLIGVFGATMFGTLTFGFNSLRSEMRTSAEGLRGEMHSLRGELRGEIDGVREEMRSSVDGLRSEMRTGFEAVNSRIDYLDRDVQFLMRKEFGDSPNS